MTETETKLIPRGIDSRRRPKKPIAILSHSISFALGNIRGEVAPVSYRPLQMRGKFHDGQEFLIATERRHLEGQRICGFRIEGHPSEELVALAVARTAAK